MTQAPKNSAEQDVLLEEALLAAAQEMVAVRADADAQVAALRLEIRGLNEQLEEARLGLAEATGTHQRELVAMRMQLGERAGDTTRPLQKLIGELGPHLQAIEGERAKVRDAELQVAELRRQLVDMREEKTSAERQLSGLLLQVEALEERFADTAAELAKVKAQAAADRKARDDSAAHVEAEGRAVQETRAVFEREERARAERERTYQVELNAAQEALANGEAKARAFQEALTAVEQQALEARVERSGVEAELRSLQRELEGIRDELRGALAERDTARSQLAEDRQARAGEWAEAHAQAAELEQALEDNSALRAELGNVQRAAEQREVLIREEVALQSQQAITAVRSELSEQLRNAREYSSEQAATLQAEIDALLAAQEVEAESRNVAYDKLLSELREVGAARDAALSGLSEARQEMERQESVLHEVQQLRDAREVDVQHASVRTEMLQKEKARVAELKHALTEAEYVIEQLRSAQQAPHKGGEITTPPGAMGNVRATMPAPASGVMPEAESPPGGQAKPRKRRGSVTSYSASDVQEEVVFRPVTMPPRGRNG